MVSTAIKSFYSERDHFKSLKPLIGLAAKVTACSFGQEDAHLEGIITAIRPPQGRECYTEELGIQMGENYVNIQVSRYEIEQAGNGLKVTGYLDNGSKVLEIAALYMR